MDAVRGVGTIPDDRKFREGLEVSSFWPLHDIEIFPSPEKISFLPICSQLPVEAPAPGSHQAAS